MKTQEQWEEREKELEELVELRKVISSRIHELKVRIAQHKKQMANPPDKTDTLAYQMFGKRMKDFTAEEYKAYYNARQRVNRPKRKQGIKQRPASLKNAKTLSEQIFGKRYKELSPEEKRVYNRLSQKKHREVAQ